MKEPIKKRAMHHLKESEYPTRLPYCPIKNKHSYSKKKVETVRLFLLKNLEVKYLRTYKCPTCKYWHLTSVKQKRK